MKKLLLVALSLFCLGALAQDGPRSWRDHVGISSCNTVAKLGKKVYASNYNGLVWFEETEINPQTLNKINGLSDVGIKLLRSNPYNNKMLVVYNNANLDVIDESGKISNYSEIKLKTLSGKKYINEVTFYKHLAYLACGFGIIVFDTEKMEVKDTYIIGPNATNIEVYQLALNDSLIFAATENGLYVSNYLTRQLNNFNNWKRPAPAIPNGAYCGVVNTGSTLLACYAPSRLNNFNKGKDTLYVLSNNVWSKHPSDAGKGTTIYRFGPVYGDLYSYFDLFGFVVRRISDNHLVNPFYTINDQPGQLEDVYFDKDYSGNVSYWFADKKLGLFQNYLYYMPYKKVSMNGMQNRMIGSFDIRDGRVAVAPSYADVTGVAPATTEGISLLRNGEWSYIEAKDLAGNPVRDITSVLFDRFDKTRMWATAWGYGLLEYKNDKLVSVRTTSNTNGVMPEILPGQPRCNGLSMDKDGNVWFTSSDRINYLNVVRRNGQYINFKFDAQRFSRKTYVDRNNQVWVLHEGNGGITVFKHNNFSAPVPNENYKILSNQSGRGNLQSNVVTAVAEDADGRMWVGTGAGISVFYNTAAIFSGDDYDSQPIKIVQDGNVELLLGNEKVLCIAIDGANNKWVGTATGGLYCFSPDGQTQLYHFTEENSPLYSNTVMDVSYNETTGDVFVGTEAGIQSFRSTVLAGAENYNNVVAFPNPVRPNYQGTVLIKGLLDKSIVKIADEGGNLVWEVKSSGGQVEWPVTTLSGARVSSGVYVVYASTTDGELKALTKILVVN